MKGKLTEVGFGSQKYDLAFYIANRPPIDDYPLLNSLKPLRPGEIAHIVEHTSNHWRKVFNVLAKFLMELRAGTKDEYEGTWQQYRHETLFQMHSNEVLLFSAPDFSLKTNAVHVITGKTYGTGLGLPFTLDWLDSYFAVNEEHRVIVSPYPDYRQLSNERITRLVELVKQI